MSVDSNRTVDSDKKSNIRRKPVDYDKKLKRKDLSQRVSGFISGSCFTGANANNYIPLTGCERSKKHHFNEHGSILPAAKEGRA